MGVRVVPPEASLSTSVLTELERNNECLFAVAYLSIEGVRLLAEVLDRRLDARRFSLRIICCVSDFITDPAALEELQRLGRRRNGALQLRWHTQAGFHAKAYGFRKAGKARVYVGSWNLTSKAMGAESGELGVDMMSSAVVDEAWDALERFWESGRDLTTAWLKKYKAAYSRYRKRAAGADRSIARWRSQFRGRTRTSVSERVTADSSIYFDYVVPIGRDGIAEVERARKHARSQHDLETASGWIRYSVKADAFAVPLDCPILQVHWRSPTDASKGARVIGLFRLRSRPVRIIDPESGTQMWLLYFDTIRGTRAPIKGKHAQRAARMLARHGLSWAALWKMNGGFLRGRRKPMLAALRDLRRLPK